MGEVVWSAEAASNLGAIYDYIAADSPAVAKRIIQELIASTDHLREFPNSGRIVEELKTERVREVIAPPYHIAYQVEGNTVSVLRVWHGKRMPLLKDLHA